MSLRRFARRSLAAATLLLAAPFGLPGTQPSAQAADQPATIRIASPDLSAGPKPYAGSSTVSLVHIKQALEKEFEKDGIKVEWSFFKGAGPAVNEAFSNKQIDFAYLGDLAAIIGRARGLDNRFLVGIRGSNTYLGAAPEAGIASLKDLKGKRVALFRGTADQLAFGRALAEAGLGERDLKVVNLDWTASRAALAAGQVDAIWQGVPVLALRERGLATVPASTKQIANKLATTQSGLIGASDFIQRYPQLTQRVVDVLVAEAHWAAQPANRASVEESLSQQGGIPLALIHGEYEGDDLAFRFSPRIDTFLRNSLADSVAQAKELGLIRQTFDTAAWVEPKFVEAALAKQNLQGFWPDYGKDGKAAAH